MSDCNSELSKSSFIINYVLASIKLVDHCWLNVEIQLHHRLHPCQNVSVTWRIVRQILACNQKKNVDRNTSRDFIRGYHEYMDDWQQNINNDYSLKWEPNNEKDSNAVKVKKKKDLICSNTFSMFGTFVHMCLLDLCMS